MGRLPTPFDIIGYIWNAIKEVTFVAAMLLVIVPFIRLVIFAAGVTLCLWHQHWIIGGILIVVALIATWANSEIQI